MLKLNTSSKFKKDYRRCQSQNKNMKLLENVVDILLIPALLPPENKDHPLVGNWKNVRECHILSDWILLYRIDGDELYLIRTGTHSEIYGK